MNQEKLLTTILSLHSSEKSAMVADKNRQYVFKVAADANKPNIKAAVEAMFNVKVDSVRVCNVKGKSRVFKRVAGRRSNWKKAYVTLSVGHEIDFMGAQA